MQSIQKQIGALAMTGITLITLFTASTPAQASEADEGPTPILIGHSLEDAIQIGTVEGDAPAARGIIDPIDFTACIAGNNASHVIKTYATWDYGAWWYGDDLDLKCGTDTTKGFKHIRAGHQGDWTAILNYAKSVGTIDPSITWDDYMDDAIKSTFNYPQHVAILTNLKACWVTDYSIWVGDTPKKTWWVQTIMSRNNLDIITAYPRSYSSGYACNV